MKAMKDRSINPHRFILLVNGFSKASQLSMNLPKGKIPYILENKHARYENEDSKKKPGSMLNYSSSLQSDPNKPRILFSIA